MKELCCNLRIHKAGIINAILVVTYAESVSWFGHVMKEWNVNL